MFLPLRRRVRFYSAWFNAECEAIPRPYREDGHTPGKEAQMFEPDSIDWEEMGLTGAPAEELATGCEQRELLKELHPDEDDKEQ
jgi:hypothetical protein